MARHFSTPAWKIPQMEEPGRLQSMGWQSHTQQSNFASQLGWHLASPPRMCESIGCLHHPPEEGNQGLSHWKKPEVSGELALFRLMPTHIRLGSMGTRERKATGEAAAHLPVSSFNQLCPEMSMKWEPEYAVPSRYSSHISLLVWPSHGLCFSCFETLIFNVTLLNLVFRGRDLFQGLKINTLKKWVVEVVEAPTAISKRMPHQPERLLSPDSTWHHSQGQLVF